MSCVCIKSFSKGFILGSDTGVFSLWLKDEEFEENQHETFIL
jgi:hypothetical protein